MVPGVLIADAAPHCRGALIRMIRRLHGYSGPLFEAGSAEEALATARRQHPELVFLDVHLPGMCGLQVGAHIRAERPQTRLVMLSAHEEFSAVQQALRIGASDYLLKPVCPDQVCAALTRMQLRETAAPDQPDDRSAAGRVVSPLEAAIGYMQQQLHRPDLRLSDVARAAHLSASHLAALMRRHLGRSYLQQLTHLRIERAKHLLRTTDGTVAAIAHAVGYATPAPFYQRFKQVVGTTPMGFRKQGIAERPDA
jgi:YesN/AraC family two-component response regulator